MLMVSPALPGFFEILFFDFLAIQRRREASRGWIVLAREGVEY